MKIYQCDRMDNLAYDGLNRLIKTTTADGQTIESTYGHNGLCTAKTVDGVRTDFYYDGIELITEMTDQGASSYINGINLIAIQGQDTLYYIYNGHEDVVAIADGEGAITNQYDYDIFGNVILSTEGHRNTRKYAGYYYDDETGHYYLNARYYDPKTARFITQDTYKGRYSDPLSLNLYTYCYNNPIIYWDPTGHIAWYDAINLRREINAYRSDESFSNRDIIEILTDIRSIHMKYCAEDVFALSDIHKDLLKIDYAKKNLEYVKFYKGDTKYAQQKYDAALRNAFNREMKAAGHKGTGNAYVTDEQLIQLGWRNVNDEMVNSLNNTLVKYEINTPERIRHFVSQSMHESGLVHRIN